MSRLSVYALLSNPELSGGLLRLPIKELTNMRSRPCASDDVWFPSHRNDWVRLMDGRFGQVIHQSPESVKLRVGGGAVVTYPTQQYLSLSPENLSNGFSVSVVFGIDYRHQAIGTTRIPQVMRERVEAGLLAIVKPEELVKVSVDFQSASASSLDYSVGASFTGAVADRPEALRRAIQRILVDVCNAEGWSIPFPQVTVHQAPAPAASPDESDTPASDASLARAAASALAAAAQRPQSSR